MIMLTFSIDMALPELQSSKSYIVSLFGSLRSTRRAKERRRTVLRRRAQMIRRRKTSMSGQWKTRN
jgi:hypothetical protein